MQGFAHMPATAPRRAGWHLVRLALLGLAALLMAAPARAEHPATYMQRVANELTAAARTGNAALFSIAVRKHADVTTIGLSSLGSYAARLAPRDRPAYLDGMVKFISNYASREAPKYPVARATVMSATEEDSNGVYVDTLVQLRDGTTYDVRWWLVRRGPGFKVRDASVLGFWMSPFLKSLFENYISDQGQGDPRALIVALNR